MKKMKIHKWQERFKLHHSNEEERPKFAECGQPWPKLTDDWKEVTCLRCLKWREKNK